MVSLLDVELLNESVQITLDDGIFNTKDFLKAIASQEDFTEKMAIAFGESFDAAKAEDLRLEWLAGDFDSLPAIEIRPAAEINGANGAFSADTNTIYLSTEYIEQNGSDVSAIADVLLEEIGHSVDSQINVSDALGDEGAIFSALVQDIELDASTLETLKFENDSVALTLDGQVIQIEQDNPFTGSYAQAIDQIDKLLTKLQNGINNRVFGESIPILGDKLANVNNTAVQFIDNIKTAINNEISGISDLANAKTNQILQALNKALGIEGLNILKQPIILDEESDEVVFDIKLSSNETPTFTTALDADFGLPGIDFELNGNANIDLDFEYNLKLGINKTEGFFINTSDDNELAITLDVTAPGSASGELGFLQVTATDIGTKFKGTFNVDLADSGGQLNFDEAPDPSNLVDAKLTATADINLNLATSFADAAKFPKLSTDFYLDWEFNAADIDDAKFGSLPKFGFNNVKLDLGSFLSNFAKPIIQQVRNVTQPLEPIVDVITSPLPLLDQFDINVSLLDIATNPAFAQGTPALDLLKAIPQIVNAAKALDNIDTTDGSVPIELGSFSPEVDIRQLPNLNDVPINLDDITPSTLGDPLTQAKGKSTTASNFFAGSKGGGLSFPILESPTEAFKLLLGQKDATLFKADLPSLGAEFEYSVDVPVFPGVFVKVGGKGGFSANLDFGFDTEGLFAAATGGNAADVFNKGFFVDANSGLNLFLGFKAGGGVGIPGAAELSASIFIEGIVDLKLDDPTPGDGKVKPPEILQNLAKGINCVFDVTGKVEAGAEVSYELLFVFEDSFEIARFPIPGLNFSYGCSDGGTNNPVLATDLGGNILRLNMGPNASDRGSNTPFIDAVDEVFEVQAGANPGQVFVSAFGYFQPYPTTSPTVDKIIADGGTGNDTIIIQSDVTSTVELAGGEGNDVLLAGGGVATLKGGTGDDGLNGGLKADQLFGDEGDDALKGGAGNDSLEGGSGNDILAGDAGADTLNGGTDNDKLSGGADNDFLFGDAGDDRLSGNEGDDSLDGGTENDSLFGDAGNDTLSGGDGNDRLNGGMGADNLSGGAGDDTLKGGFVQQVTQTGTDAQGLPIFSDPVTVDDPSADILDGGEGNDDLAGGAGNDTLKGGAGNDIVAGETGDDFIDADIGNDTLDGGSDVDTVSYKDSPTGVVVNIDETTDYSNLGSPVDLEPNFAIAKGTASDGFGTTDTLKNLENIIGSDFDDILIGNSADNDIQALAGNDLVIGNAGNDQLNGGDGIDTVSYRRDPDSASVYVSLEQNTAKDGFGGTDKLLNFENVVGSDFDDKIIGDEQVNILSGGKGSDFIEARGNDDTVFGNEGNDSIYGENGDDYLIGGKDADLLNGGNGNDTASYFTAESGVTASLTTGKGTLGDAKGDVFESIENLEGSNYDDRLIGDNLSNYLWGLAGDDFLDGRGGNDFIYGGLGSDRISGGAGDDQAYGEADNDDIDGGDGNDTLDGGDGDDLIWGAKGNDTLYGQVGDDALSGDQGNDILEGGVGNDGLTGGEGNDQLYGGEGNDALEGQAGNDLLAGGNGNDFILGGDDADTLLGQEGDDNLDGENGNDTLDGGIGEDLLYGAEGDDQLLGAQGNDYLEGGNGNDSLTGGDGEDILYGQDGNDSLNGSAGQDLLEGGIGNDSLAGGTENDTLLGQDGNDNLDGEAGNDLLDGGAGNDQLAGSDGEDTLYGRVGDDTLDGGTGNDQLYGEAGNDQLKGNDGEDFLSGGTGNDQLSGEAGNDLLAGGADGDTLKGGEGDDQLYGEAGDDLLLGEAGNDLIDGGSDIDTVSYQTSPAAVVVNLDLNTSYTNSDLPYDLGLSFAIAPSTALDGFGTTDTLQNVENAIGSDFGDILIGNNQANRLQGAAGNDLLMGNAGNDTLEGEAGNDILVGGAGADTLNGGAGNDTASYATATASVAASLATGTGTVGDAAGDVFQSVENLEGSQYADTLSGNKSNNILMGGKGNDSLTGGGKQDTFVVRLGDGTDAIADLGGVGKGNKPSSSVVGEVDILKFEGAGLTAESMLLTQNGKDLVITFEGVEDTKVVLQNFALQNLDNLLKATGASVDSGNILFDGQSQIQDSFDVFDDKEKSSRVLRKNTVTFLNDSDNRVKGFDNSNDVINAQGGNDTLEGLSGNDILRGGNGNDVLVGGDGDDILHGGAGQDKLYGGSGSDVFGLAASAGSDTIFDFVGGNDSLKLVNGLTFEQLTITQGAGINASNTLIGMKESGELLAVLVGVQANSLTTGDFTVV